MRFKAEIFEERFKPHQPLWDAYPFEGDGGEVWISLEDMSDQQIDELTQAIREIGERRHAEAQELRQFGRLRQAGITGVIDGGRLEQRTDD